MFVRLSYRCCKSDSYFAKVVNSALPEHWDGGVELALPIVSPAIGLIFAAPFKTRSSSGAILSAKENGVMLRPVVPMFGLPIYAIDGKIGTFFDIYFNDSAWNIELMVIEVTDLLFDRHVLVSPSSFFIDADGALHVRLTMGQVRRRPDYDGDGSVPERFGDNGGMPLSQLSDDAMVGKPFPPFTEHAHASCASMRYSRSGCGNGGGFHC